MKDFADLYWKLDSTTKTNLRIQYMREYFSSCPAADGAWVIYFLSGRKLKRLINTTKLRTWGAAKAELPLWMFEECYEAVGDLAETMALLLSPPEAITDYSLVHWVEQKIKPLADMDELHQQTALYEAWDQLNHAERFIYNKIITGSLRVGVSQNLVIRALADAFHKEPNEIAHQLMGEWEPTPEFFELLREQQHSTVEISRPYPFCLAHPLQEDPQTLGDIKDWLLEWKWDGIRTQIIKRKNQGFIWSRGEELLQERFPEFDALLSQIPNGTVLDGEIVIWKNNQVAPFAELQKRIGRKKVTKKMLSDVPAKFIAFDLLEFNYEDYRQHSMEIRRAQLETLLPHLTASTIIPSPQVEAENWNQCAEIRSHSREMHVEGLMLKLKKSPYEVGRKTGLWWKWKVEPYSCDAVLIYAQKGHGKRASLYTDYTFGAWRDGQLVPFAKAYSGLTDAEIREVDRFIRKNTLEKFGPVSVVKPELVFELAFENVQLSNRHKSGIAVRFPRMARWRTDKTPEQADSLESIKTLVNIQPQLVED